MSPDNLITISQFAQLFHVSLRSTYRLLKQGLPSRKIPHVGRRILLQEAQQWLLLYKPNKRSIKNSTT